ncbi:TMEM175 family protein [Micromonospora avicenniae]|uniref:TMEM175 family protein n=1 Tax=Micromonospora avicenniae TaxID=1198245 RepID=UPI0034406602
MTASTPRHGWRRGPVSAAEEIPEATTAAGIGRRRTGAAVRTGRLEAFSDGVLAIIITIMVLELKVPEGHSYSDLIHTSGVGLLVYLLSFVFVGIYWNTHHQLFHLVRQVSGGVLWANLALLFCLSLVPFTTAWVSESKFEQTPVVIYGLNLLSAAVAYVVLQTVIIRQEGPDSPLRRAVGADLKGKLSIAFDVAGVVSALTIDRDGHVGVSIAMACLVLVVIVWVVPDRRIDRALRQNDVPT